MVKAKKYGESTRTDWCGGCLKWAARTYVVAAIGSLATLLYFLLQVLGNNRD